MTTNELLGLSTLEKLSAGVDDGLTDWGEASELTDWTPCQPTPADQEGVPFWLCAEFYSGSGRLSRTWIEQADTSPDAPSVCDGSLPACKDAERSPWSHEMAHIGYPFNGMGGEVVAGPFQTRAEAVAAEETYQDRSC